MNQGLDTGAVQAAVRAGRIQWHGHALRRMAERGLARQEVVAVLLTGEPIEDYPDDYPLPSALFLEWTGGRPIHVVAAFNRLTNTIHVITAYEPGREHFEDNFTTRKTRQ